MLSVPGMTSNVFAKHNHVGFAQQQKRNDFRKLDV